MEVQHPEWFDDEVAWLEARWRRRPPPTGAVVFYGSSSIRLWSSLAQDLSDLPVVNAGFGGSTMAACAQFCERLIVPHRPRSLLVYAGDNDLGAGCSPEDVCASFGRLLATLDQHLPGVRVVFLSIKPSPARWSLQSQMEETNALCRRVVEARPGGGYIDVVAAMLGPQGLPRDELYAEDDLHLSAEGYRLWTQVIGQHRAMLA